MYIFHGFRKEPNTDRLCLALHTACQARYKRVLEAHPELAAGGKDKRRSKEVRMYIIIIARLVVVRQ